MSSFVKLLLRKNNSIVTFSDLKFSGFTLLWSICIFPLPHFLLHYSKYFREVFKCKEKSVFSANYNFQVHRIE